MLTQKEIQLEIAKNRLLQVRLMQEIQILDAADDMKLRGQLGRAVLANLANPSIHAFASSVQKELKGVPARKLAAALKATEEGRQSPTG
jgi:hypothetical protein